VPGATEVKQPLPAPVRSRDVIRLNCIRSEEIPNETSGPHYLYQAFTPHDILWYKIPYSTEEDRDVNT
jgi:hypothetical protein